MVSRILPRARQENSDVQALRLDLLVEPLQPLTVNCFDDRFDFLVSGNRIVTITDQKR